jgi:hypothetical protein
MRHVQRPFALAQDTAEFKFHFQMISGGARHACSVAIRAADEVKAVALFRENWPAIETLARKNLAINAAKEIRLNLAWSNGTEPKQAGLAAPVTEQFLSGAAWLSSTKPAC